MKNKHPIYIVSKGRWEQRITARTLDAMNVPYFMVVEGSEYNDYAKYFSPSQLLTLPKKYLDEYDTFWPREADNKTGPGAARNFAWDHSISIGAAYHWVMDDNIEAFYRMNRNEKPRSTTGSIFSAAEDFVERYENVPLAGFNYHSFCKKTDKVPPFYLNTRIYSCLLIRNDMCFKWRGRYNEDTDLSLRVLKAGDCTIQFNAFLCGKITTQRVSGGNTAEFYEKEGTMRKSKMLEEMHPDVAKVVWKFNRWHHHVDYRSFQVNRLKLKEGVVIPDSDNEYGMVLIEGNHVNRHERTMEQGII